MINVNGINCCYSDHANGNSKADGCDELEQEISYVYITSAKDPSVLEAINKKLAAYLLQLSTTNSLLSPADLAYTLAERRSRLPWATAIKASGLKELAERLNQPNLKATRAIRSPRIGFVFNGQGAQWHGMGRELIGRYPAFANTLQLCDQILRDYGASWSLCGKAIFPVRSMNLSDTR
jgi:acyl transferase domain-containing protein